jgi:hypothetical protein
MFLIAILLALGAFYLSYYSDKKSDYKLWYGLAAFTLFVGSIVLYFLK